MNRFTIQYFLRYISLTSRWLMEKIQIAKKVNDNFYFNCVKCKHFISYILHNDVSLSLKFLRFRTIRESLHTFKYAVFEQKSDCQQSLFQCVFRCMLCISRPVHNWLIGTVLTCIMVNQLILAAIYFHYIQS